ncbi:MAG: NAD(P)-dependent oxidoreductase [Burkholderiaceae bacterium]|nr:glyoxylate/hydroxypyruvate reductase A [Burkholderiales bacterium]MCZ8340087.1 NAD(P)-dependent oxidoreductase [Burkholderiaceae bacterium]
MAALILSRPMPPEPFAEALRARGFPHPVHTTIDGDWDPASIRWLVAWRLPAGVLPRLPNLELLFNCAAGVDKLLATPDLPPGLPIARVADDAQAIELAQYVVHAALDHLRIAPRYRAQQAARDWTRHRAPAVGLPALVLGLGPIGMRIARSLATMGFVVSGWSRSPRDVPGIETFAGADGLAAALPRARVLVCALPLTPETTGLVDAALLARLPRGAFFVNIGRGGHVVEPDLIAALASGQLSGATIDVQAREPMPADDPLWDAPNLTLTPHVAGQLDPDTVMAQFAEEIERLGRGEPLRRPVDPVRGY